MTGLLDAPGVSGYSILPDERARREPRSFDTLGHSVRDPLQENRMPGMHALHKILANCARPQRQRVAPGEFLEVEPDAVIAESFGAPLVQ
jgi:hypothetical protein